MPARPLIPRVEVLQFRSPEAPVPTLSGWQAKGKKPASLRRSRVSGFQTRLTRKGHSSVLYDLCPFTRPNPSVGGPVCRVSDEGGFWASMAVRPRAARQPRERQKPTEFGDGHRGGNSDKSLARQGSFQKSTCPQAGIGVGIP